MASIGLDDSRNPRQEGPSVGDAVGLRELSPGFDNVGLQGLAAVVSNTACVSKSYL